MRKMNIIFSSFPDFSGNSKAMYEYIKNKNKFGNLTWVIYDSKTKEMLSKKGINCVSYGSNQFDTALKKANIIFDTHGNLLSEKRENQIYINLWHGMGPKKTGYLLDINNLAPQDVEYCNRMQKKADYLIVSSELWRCIFSSLFNLDFTRVLSLGMPRCDYLFKSDGRKNLQSLINLDLKKYNKIIMYLPTYRKGCERGSDGILNKNNVLSLENYNEEALLEYLQENKYLLVIKLHPSEETTINKIKHSNIMYLEDSKMTANLLTIYEIMNCVDLLITDYSSVYTEYLLLSRPVLFLDTDIEKYLDKRGIVFDNTEFWFPGPKVNRIENLFNELDKLISIPTYYFDERRKFLDLMFKSKKADNCKRVYDYIFSEDGISSKCTPNIDIEYKLTKELEESKMKIARLDDDINSKQQECEILENEINSIRNSKTWKLVSFIWKIKRKVFFFIK